MKNNNRSDYTINFTRKALSLLNKHTDLNQPEQVKQFIANKHVSNGYKRNLCIAYNKFCKYYKIQWEMPLYKTEAKPIRIPTKEKLEMLIARARQPLSIKLTISKETGLRPIELTNLKLKDIDLDQRLIYPTTAKNGSNRTLKISIKLKEMLQEHIHKHNLNPNDKLFKGNADYGKKYRKMRNKLAQELHDPTLKTIRLYDFRHYFATTLYAKTRDILFVKQQMGHRKIETTLIYTQLIHFNEEEEYTCKTANNINEATQLIETGFEYITDMDNLKLFRKRK